MNPGLRNILAVVAGCILGGLINGLLVSISSSVIPLPEGIDPNDIENLKANIDRFEIKHFLMPFLAHALGTLIGAFTTAKLAASNHSRQALIVGIFFLIGGIMAARMIGGPLWFNIVDLVLAYLPMAWLGGRLGHRSS